ncbi:TIGR04222 domain-containing membrane protein [Streptomyces sp. CA-294286]|uniref:TIGR04222 domain-containing membrane protein n=1 Tax=Streptomyces sp. CA-294286 TaxID=3240070 RepID=UPI003D907434
MSSGALSFVVNVGVCASAVLLVLTLALARRRRRGDAALHDVLEAAFLSGGPGRAVDTALVAMHADGRIGIGGPGIVVVRSRRAHDTVERAVLQEYDAAPSGALHSLRHAVMRHPAVQEIGDSLAARGLLVTPRETRVWRRWGLVQGFVCLLGLPLSLIATFFFVFDTAWGVFGTDEYPDGVFGTDEYPDAGSSDSVFVLRVLPVLLMGVVTGFAVAHRARRRVTATGRTALRAYRTDPAHLVTAAQQVAVGGVRVLGDEEMRDRFRAAIRRRPAPVPSARGSRTSSSDVPPAFVPVVWCAGTVPGGGRASCGSGSGCGGGSGSTCYSTACGSGGGGCGSSGGTSCGGGGSSCSSSSSSCSSGSGGGSSCGSSS